MFQNYINNMKIHWLIFVIFGIFVFYSLKCIISRIKIKENLINFCTPIFTADGTEVTISPFMYTSKYLGIDLNSSQDNVILSSIANTWVFERIINIKGLDKSVGDITDLQVPQGYSTHNTHATRCSVYIKTKSSFKTNNLIPPNYLYYYITTNIKNNFVPGVGNSYINASLFGKSTTQSWYIIDIAELPTISDNLEQQKMINIANKARSTIDATDTNTKYVYIINTSSSNPTFLTYNSSNSDLGTATLLTTPTIDSIWKINIKKTGTIPDDTNYKPTLAIGEFPNNDNTTHSTFMSFFLPMWNRKWYTNKNGNIQTFTVNLCTTESIINGEYNVKNTYAAGSVTLSDNTIYNIRTYGSDMVYGNNGNSKIILKMVPQTKKPNNTLPEGIPMLQGWIEDSNGKVTSICASNEQNLAGVCLSPPLPDGMYQMYLTKLDFLPIDPKINYNLSNNLSENFTWEDTVNYNNISGCASQYLGNLNNCVK